MDANSRLSPSDVKNILNSAGIGEGEHIAVIDFLLYYGVLGILSGGIEYFIYSVNYDPKILKIRMGRDNDAQFIVNPAFWPALSIAHAPSPLLDASLASAESQTSV